MRACTVYEGCRRQSHRVSAAGHLQGGCSGDFFCSASGMDGGHPDSEVMFFSKGESDRDCVVSSARGVAVSEVTRVQQRTSFASAADRVGRTCSRTDFSQLSPPAKARRITRSETHCTARREDFAAAFPEESMVGQVEMPSKADAPNAAITLRLHSEHHWRGVGDLRRSAADWVR